MKTLKNTPALHRSHSLVPQSLRTKKRSPPWSKRDNEEIYEYMQMIIHFKGVKETARNKNFVKRKV